ncbi:MAG: hypothetical protein ACLQUY_03515 [Ktedonobacterales bacterium]
MQTALSPLWTVEACLHAGKMDVVRFLAKESDRSFASLVKIPKEELAQLLCGLLNEKASAAERAVTELPVTVGLTPRELEAALGCTRSERRRWVAEGRLPVCATMRMYLKTNRWVDVDLVDRRAVAALAPDAVERWRFEHQKLVAERRKAGVMRAIESRARTLALQQVASREVTGLQAGWLEKSGGDPLIVAALTVAHWTVWASRRAKWHREERAEADYGATPRRFPVRHWKQERRWYGYKDQALHLLYRTGWLQVRFYQPNLLWIDELCASHYEDWCEERSFLHTSFGEFVGQHEKELARCGRCTKDPLHYALYSLELRPPFLQGMSSYRFHVPYSIGKTYLPERGTLMRVVEKEEAEGLFRFGRPLEDEEVAKYSDPFVERHITRAMVQLQARLES